MGPPFSDAGLPGRGVAQSGHFSETMGRFEVRKGGNLLKREVKSVRDEREETELGERKTGVCNICGQTLASRAEVSIHLTDAHPDDELSDSAEDS